MKLINYISPIDPHVHLRGSEYEGYHFLKLGFRDAMLTGIIGLGEQPNTKPPLTDVSAIKSRLIESESYRREGISHFIHIGMTNDLEQNKASLEAVMSGVYGLRSDKTFNTHSTGNMGITNPEIRREIMFLKGKLGYNGVSIFHAEDENLFSGEYNFLHPITHTERQNEESETASIEETIRNAVDANFKGVIYFAHVSSPNSIDYIKGMRDRVSFKVAIEATWHHTFLNASEDYSIHGNRVKMNPPLRYKSSQEKILEHVLMGDVDVIGSDHATHPVYLKDLKVPGKTPPSGIPALPFWPKGVELLRHYGIREELLENLISKNANRIFNLNLIPKNVTAQYNPLLWEAYGYNPFSRIDRTN